MTKQRVAQYKKLQREIEMLEERIADSRNSAEYDMVQSASNFPFSKKPVIVKGMGSKSLPKLLERRDKRIAECLAIEDFINSIENGIMWQLLTRRYIEGMTLQETADKVGYSYVHTRRLIDNFFEKMIHDDP